MYFLDENGEKPSKSNSNKEITIDSNQIWSSATINQSTPITAMSTSVSTSTTVQHSGQPGPKEEVPAVEANITDKQVTRPTPSNIRQQKIPGDEDIQESISSKAVPLKTSQNTTTFATLVGKTKNEKILNRIPGLEDKTVHTLKPNEPHVKIEKENSDGINVKTEDSYSTPEVTKPVDDTKKAPEKHIDSMVESDVTFEMTPDGMEIEQPSLADKDLQQPYLGKFLKSS